MAFVRADVEQFIGMLAAAGGPQLNEVDPPTARALYLQMGTVAERPAPTLARRVDLTAPGAAGPIKARLYQAAPPTGPAPAISFFHGGGWVIGDLDSHDSLCAEIAALSGLTVVAFDYRLAPEARWPAAVDDCLAAIGWMAQSPAEVGHAVEGQILAGDSAGGNLSAIGARALRRELPILAQWLIYPGVDMTATGGSMAEFAEGYLLTGLGMQWFGDHYAAEVTDPRASPLLSDDWEGLPPALVFTCGLDPLRDQGRAYAARLVAAGNRVIFREAAGQVHGSAQLRGAIPSAQADLEAQVADLRALIA
jgi:acetyl esterase